MMTNALQWCHHSIWTLTFDITIGQSLPTSDAPSVVITAAKLGKGQG